MASERVVTALACSSCKRKNYVFVRGRKPEKKVELNKFCKACDKQTLHKETKPE